MAPGGSAVPVAGGIAIRSLPAAGRGPASPRYRHPRVVASLAVPSAAVLPPSKTLVAPLCFLRVSLHVLLLRHRRFLGAGLHLTQLSRFWGPPQPSRLRRRSDGT